MTRSPRLLGPSVAPKVRISDNPTARMAALGIAARVCRLEAGIGLRAAAERAGRSKTWLSDLEKGDGGHREWRRTLATMTALYGGAYGRAYRAAAAAMLQRPAGSDPISRAIAAATLEVRGIVRLGDARARESSWAEGGNA